MIFYEFSKPCYEYFFYNLFQVISEIRYTPFIHADVNTGS